MSNASAARVACRRALERAGLPLEAVFVSEPFGPEVAEPPEGPWVVVPVGPSYLVGGCELGRFAVYDTVGSATEAAALVVRLVRTHPHSRPSPGRFVLDWAGVGTAQAIHQRTRERGGAPGSVAVSVGDVLDVIGPETGHHLFAAGTPPAARSQRPRATSEYHCYQVREPLTDAWEGVAAAWFDRPGHGAMVMTQHPIRWYADQGMLVELT